MRPTMRIAIKSYPPPSLTINNPPQSSQRANHRHREQLNEKKLASLNKPLIIGTCFAVAMLFAFAGTSFAKLDFNLVKISDQASKPTIRQSNASDKGKLTNLLVGGLAIYGCLGRLMWNALKAQPAAPNHQRRLA